MSLPRGPRGPARDSLEELREQDLSIDCPHCRDRITLNPVAGPVDWIGGYTYFIGRCPNTERRGCRPIFAVHQQLNDVITEAYPIPTFNADLMHDAIPLNIREDFAEARRCTYVKAHKGAVAIYRRVVEATACDKLGEDAKNEKGKTKRLMDLIDAMHANGLIIKDLQASAHEIRHFGNYGAHIQDDGLDSVSADEVADVAEIAWQLLSSIYVAPAKTTGLRQKRESKGAP